ncbi:MAG: alpha/beta fold hydrolase [Candidatus Kapabacteria bacterium]|nr:alpha/beta fold hydrolase [Candidatus Kapabacteria bacterium]
MTPDGTLLSSAPVAMPAAIRNMMKRAMSATDFAAFSAVQMFHITYASEGLTIHGYMALPPANATGVYPAILFNRGGAGERGALTDDGAFLYAGVYASWGYVVLASNYRGQGGSTGAEEWGAGDVRDAENLIPLLQSLGYVDMERVGLIGGSRGGMMAYMMLRRSQSFRAAATIGAPSMLHLIDHHAHIRKTFDRFVHYSPDIQRDLRERSAVAWAHELPRTTPLLMQHGTGDRRVDALHSLTLATELQRLHHPYKLIMYDNADHILAGRREEGNADLRWWMDHYVRDRAPLPKTGPHGA